ncbi:glycosyl transferase family 2 [Methanocaldococcus infernus ME]|uniref:Glycosyl transferase family 2 n=1 Tax=Methanocaldococcus infernus (strain DSM 11812 / JCM 15783 / ME) TaxID=573063 RepID=D5VTI3_METIM|nr:glycosyl transferase family 2 [Methanocaldococcus infernus ME]
MIVAVVPAYNEEKNIEKVLKELDEIKIDAIVVDDGSEDRTSEKVKNFKPKNIKIFLIRNNKNLGKAKALELGTKEALRLGYKYIAYIDGDYQLKPRDILKLYKLLKEREADAVFGVRKFDNIPFPRKITNFLANLLVSFAILVHTKRFYFLRDVQCGLRLIKADLLKDIYFGKDYSVEHIVAIQLIKKGAKILEEEIDVEYHEDAVSYLNSKKVLDVIKEVLNFIF